MAVDTPAIREVVERVFARQDVLNACKRRDLSTMITILGANGVTQIQIAALMGKTTQGRLSEYKMHKRAPTMETFKKFADGLGLPPAARLALGLASEAADSGSSEVAGGRPADIAGAGLGDVRPLLSNLSRTSAAPVLSALRGMHRGYVEADRLMGSLCVAGPIQLQMPVIEKACEVSRGADRIEMLRFACQFAEFGGWIFQDAGDLTCAMQWTNRALDYALELGDERVIAYTLMRKAMIATEGGTPAQGLGIADAALRRKDSLTPRLRAVILRQRSYSNAVLGEVIATARDADEAVTEAVAGENQDEEDRAPYCTPTYAAMEAGASWVLLGHPKTAIPILEKSRSEWADHTEVRDYALCVSRLALAYAAAGDVERACAAADEVVALAQGLGSRRVVSQLSLLYRGLERWRRDPAVAGVRGRLKMLADSFKPEREAS
jgi:transcriptional regulator with XRE-family HTH domain/tetratricopeptide (TPR) repeat protein